MSAIGAQSRDLINTGLIPLAVHGIVYGMPSRKAGGSIGARK